MISITAAPEAPPPRIRILDARQREVETVRIGDRLTFRIEIPEDSEDSFPATADVMTEYQNWMQSKYVFIFSSLWHLRPQLCRYG